MFKEWYTGATKQASEMYQLTETEQERLETEPGAVISDLMGRMHVQIFAGAYAQIVNDLPRILPQAIDNAEKSKSGIDSFYQTWPELKDHPQVVENAAAVLRRNSPNATVEEAIEKIGIMACLSAGVHSPKLSAMANPAAVPAANVLPTADTAVPDTYVPPAPSATLNSTAPPAPDPANQWVDLVETFNAEE
jgi:hypothetical protein